MQGEDVGELQLVSDDYLQGVIGMVNELVSAAAERQLEHECTRADQQPRLAVNSVTAQNFALPPRIASFIQDVFSAFTSLNLRNDALRRKFDSIKYGVARCEDVVYDLTLRGLT